jgi:catechol 2,3-dioxygenase-like lactoylglutathione lyase family enzyme
MAIKGIDHWVIVAGDLQRTLKFYEGLGFTIAWEQRPGRPDMATIRINDAQKINVHGPDAPARPGYLGARKPTVGGADFCLEWGGTVDEVLALLKRNGIVPEAGPGPRTVRARNVDQRLHPRSRRQPGRVHGVRRVVAESCREESMIARRGSSLPRLRTDSPRRGVGLLVRFLARRRPLRRRVLLALSYTLISFARG